MLWTFLIADLESLSEDQLQIMTFVTSSKDTTTAIFED